MKLKSIIGFLAITVTLFLISLNACSPSVPGDETQQGPSATPTRSVTQRSGALAATATPEEVPPEATPTPLLGDILSERTLEPTATLGALMRNIEESAARKGLSYSNFLGINLVDWVNILISALIALSGYLLGTWLIKRLLPRLVKRTASQFDNALLEKIGAEVRWLVTVIIFRAALTDRLRFIGERFNQTLKDIFFILTLSLIIWILWKVLTLSAELFTEKQINAGREEIKPVIQMVSKFIQILTGIIGITILLSYFGVNVTSLTTALGIGGLAFSLAAKDTVSDAISGLIILVDQPFRVGDRIEIQSVGTWGDVTEIGLRTTRIRTRDNRMVIVPNSIIGNNQVINYTYPDPRYRIETHVFVDFNEDVELIRQLLMDALRQVEGVLPDKPVDALFIDMTQGPIKFRLRWWIESYVDTRRMFDRVHTAIKHALDEAGIGSPVTSDNINLLVDPITTERLSRAFRRHPSEDANRFELDMPEDIDRETGTGKD
jgi:small-conductance mechanosensitive channel